MPDVMTFVAVEVPQIIKDIGAYAGFAAVIGLGVLSALYFSQARDVKRLREWAGRAPERAAEEEARVQAAARAAAVAGGAKPAAATQAGKAALPQSAPAQAAAAQTAAARTAVGAKPAAGGGGVATAPRIPTRTVSQETAVIGQGAPPTKLPWYRRIEWPEPRYIALIVAGVLVVGGGAAFGVTKLLEDDAPKQQPAGAGGDADESARVIPEEVKVSVLNGTAVNGLAATIGDKLKRKGYQVVNQANATDQQRAESVVLWVGEAKDEARSVARALDISQKEKADQASIELAGDAIVIVVVGADQTDPAAPPAAEQAPPTQTVPPTQGAVTP